MYFSIRVLMQKQACNAKSYYLFGQQENESSYRSKKEKIIV